MIRSSIPPVLLATLLVAVSMSGCIDGGTSSDWAFDVTQIDGAKALGRSGQGIRMGILDTGIDVSHAAFDELLDGDRDNGELMDFRDFVSDRSGIENAHDDHGHGTHVIGIIAAHGSPLSDKILYGGIDPVGGAPNVQLWVAKVCAEDPQSNNQETICSDQAIRDALQWLSQQQVDIVTMSLGGPHRQNLIFADATTNAVNGLIDSGVVVVASAGNSGPSNDDVSSPADIPGVIAVGAIQEDGTVWAQSSRGSNTRCEQSVADPVTGQVRCVQETSRAAPDEKPEVVAPGVDIWSTWKGGVYARADGTSQAAPFVASGIALALESERRYTTRDEVVALKQALTSTAKQLPSHHSPHDDASGYGLIQVVDLIRAL